MTNQHTLFVCVTCSNSHHPSTSAATGGKRLLERLSQLQLEWDWHPPLQLRSVKCMGVCERDCAIALSCPGKFTYLFGNLSTDDQGLEPTASALLDCASQYAAKLDGFLSYHERPELLKTRVIARIPPILQ